MQLVNSGWYKQYKNSYLKEFTLHFADYFGFWSFGFLCNFSPCTLSSSSSSEHVCACVVCAISVTFLLQQTMLQMCAPPKIRKKTCVVPFLLWTISLQHAAGKCFLVGTVFFLVVVLLECLSLLSCMAIAKLLEMIHGSDRCLVQLDVSLIIPKVWTMLSFTIAQIISVLTAEVFVTVL